jgi:hypothetical protein
LGHQVEHEEHVNSFISVEICLPIDIGDFLFVLWSVDSLVVFPGGAGTMAEIALAYRMKIPMVILTKLGGDWDAYVGRKLDNSPDKLCFYGTETSTKAVEIAYNLANKIRRR